MKAKIIYLLVLFLVTFCQCWMSFGQTSYPATVGISYGTRKAGMTCMGGGLCGAGADATANVTYICTPNNTLNLFVLTMPCNTGNLAVPVGVTTWTIAAATFGNNPSFTVPGGTVFTVSNNGLTLTAQNPSSITCTGCTVTPYDGTDHGGSCVACQPGGPDCNCYLGNSAKRSKAAKKK
jgi:hypothetical protein